MSPPTLNPVMIKELRQLVRGRFIAGVLVTFLAAQLVIIGAYVLGDPSLAVPGTGRAAQPLLRVLLGALSMACCLCVPAYVGIRFSLEHQPGNADLLFVTTLTPGTIVRGKLYSGILTTALLMSVSMPYMTFIYLLRGIDLPTVFSALAFVFLMSVVLIQFAILMGALPTSRAFKGLSAIGLCFFVSSAGMLPLMLMRGLAFPPSSSPLSTVQLGALLAFLLS
ncbi:MAG: hypothetical protein FJ279_32800, partial [Planctomycetes bacterium]|nr:hypothetical protein [Planctomycetota bacterium]